MFRLLFCITICQSTLLLADTLPLQQVMTEEEMQKIGLDDATPQQKQAFESWLATWTHRVLEQAPSYRPGQDVSLWVQAWPSYANPTKTKLSQKELDERMKANQRIDKVKQDGAIIELKDGSIWAVSPLYTYLTKDWLRDHVIKIEPSENVLYTYRLTDVNLGQVAEANMKQPASPKGEKKPENPDEYKGAVALVNTSSNGDTVTLSNGTTWQIAPVDMYKVRTWKEHDRIRVEQVDNFLYQYRLTNLDTGQTTLANKG